MIKEAPTVRAALSPKSDRRCCPICGETNPVAWLTAPDRFNGRHTPYHLLRCPACSVAWLHDPPSPSEMGDHYGADYDRAIAEARQSPDHWAPRVKELSRLKTRGALLDLGCGSGGFLNAVKGPSWTLSGIEISEGAASVARNRCNAEVFVGDALDAPFAPESFDVITCFNVFEHFYEPRKVLAKVAEWLKPGGIFYTIMPNSDSAATRIFRSYWYALELPRHLFHFSPVALRQLAKSCGLQEVSITTHRELYFDASVRYMVDDLLRKVGISRRPLAVAKEPSLPFKVVRKLFRMTVLPLFAAGASLAGDGETIMAVFTKR